MWTSCGASTGASAAASPSTATSCAAARSRWGLRSSWCSGPDRSGAALLLALPLVEGDRLVGQHDRDVVLDAVDQLRLAADQELPVRGELERGLAHRADQDVEQLLADGHGRFLTEL